MKGDNMKIMLVAPRRDEVVNTETIRSVAPPLALAVLASLTPPDAQVKVADENFFPLDFDAPLDLVGITVSTQTAPRAYEVADRFRARGVKVVLGGMHPTALPEEAALHADAVVVGEAEETWPRLLEDVRNEGLRTVYGPSAHPELAGLPPPRRDLFQSAGYVFPHTIYTTRGCPFGCDFCSVTSFFGGTYRSRPIGEVMKEIDALEHERPLFFVDDNIAGHRGRAKELFTALASRKRPWIGQATVSIARDEELLSLAAASGCLFLFLGIESLSPESLGSVGKRHNRVDDYEDAFRRIHAHGIAIFGAFIFGLDGDTEDVFEETVRFARRNRLEGAQFNILTPYPGTPLHANMEREGRILIRDWSQYRGDRVVIEPRLMSARTLQDGHTWAWQEFYSLGSIWGRVGVSHPHRSLVWALNLNQRSDRVSRKICETLLTTIH
jgi:radical SAM superfamily enzyme YgiQ (UPF0313 family)